MRAYVTAAPSSACRSSAFCCSTASKPSACCSRRDISIGSGGGRAGRTPWRARCGSSSGERSTRLRARRASMHRQKACRVVHTHTSGAHRGGCATTAALAVTLYLLVVAKSPPDTSRNTSPNSTAPPARPSCPGPILACLRTHTAHACTHTAHECGCTKNRECTRRGMVSASLLAWFVQRLACCKRTHHPVAAPHLSAGSWMSDCSWFCSVVISEGGLA
jgi:hypothetical protein